MLTEKIKAVEDAKDALDETITDLMEETARKLGLTYMYIHPLKNTYKIGHIAINSAALDRLNSLYIQHIGADFESTWTPEKGWTCDT